jgi:hypothetical protein
MNALRKLLTLLGAAVLLLIVIGVGGLAYLWVQGTGQDTEARLYANNALPPVISSWSLQALRDRASPELLANTKPEQLTALFQWFKTLGTLKTLEPCLGQTQLNVNTFSGRTLTGQYSCHAQFQAGEATIQMSLIKRDNAWRITGFHVSSPALVPAAQTEKT